MTILLASRAVLRLKGEDRQSFLQGLITQDIRSLSSESPLYAAMLNPQGKVLYDFFLYAQSEEIWLECWREKAAEIQQKLMLYKLRAKVAIECDEALAVYSDVTERSSGQDPRHPQLGSRFISAETLTAEAESAYHAHRLTLGIPDSTDFVPDRSFPMEFGLSDLHAISYTKGCYVGQEVVARSKTRGVLHKALHQVQAQTALPPMDTPIMAGDKEVGVMRSVQGNHGLAVLRIEEAANAPILTAAGVTLTAKIPDWFSVPAGDIITSS